MSNKSAKSWFKDREKNQTLQRSLATMSEKAAVIAPSHAKPRTTHLQKEIKDLKAALPQAETGGPKGPEPTRYGDWERKGRCIDF